MDLTAFFLLAVEPSGRLFGLDAQTLFDIGLQLFNVSVLAVALSYLLYKPVLDFLRRRSEKIREQLKRAANDIVRGEEFKAEYEKKLETIAQERSEILDAAHKLAAQQQREILTEAKKEADAIREQARSDVRREQEQIKESLRLHIIDVSSLMTEKFIARSIDKELQDKLFAETMAELEDAAWPS
ncbi:MAG: F0F1 ATP synthase subunit B [Defluviitaleaceae bacterium]|nr:F0F1 ATP synthase subunit B [Defluviitaleaceae bacterium]